MTISISTMDAPIGAEIHGADLSRPLAPADVDAIAGAWRKRLVLADMYAAYAILPAALQAA